MEEITINSSPEFHSFLAEHYGVQYLFRGVRDKEFQLIPKIGRPEFNKGDRKAREIEYLTLFKQRAIQHLKVTPRDDWEWLALAQHHGLPTRLLDWSYNPLVALFFAIEAECKTDSAVYVYDTSDHPTSKLAKSPLTITSTRVYHPSHITPRLTAQSGVFTAHHEPSTPLEDPKMIKLLVPNKHRKHFKKALFQCGVHSGSAFPDLDGLAKLITWQKGYSY